jgi:phosphoribosylaminoimidazole carboxylase PurE protein
MPEQDLRAERLAPQREQLVVIVMGSEADLEHSQKIAKTLNYFGVDYKMRVGSAHKTPQHVTNWIDEYEGENRELVFIAVAGRSNALGGFMDFQTTAPVISSPPYSEKYAGGDIYSSLRMPSGSAAVTAIEPEMAALAAVKIFALNNTDLTEKYLHFQMEARLKILEADNRISQL